MGEISTHRPVMLIAAVSSRYDDAFSAARKKAIELWGEIALESKRFHFTETEFYESTMGTDLYKQFWAFENLIDPADVAQAKVHSNEIEALYNVDEHGQSRHPESRAVNIDPGYISEAKLVLATTKNRDHRIYLQKGIFAEVTLHFHRGSWAAARWTYPDYQREDFQNFFTECRNRLRSLYRVSDEG